MAGGVLTEILWHASSKHETVWLIYSKEVIAEKNTAVER
jgi:hypothetical protein